MRRMCLLLLLLSMSCNVLSSRLCRGDDEAPDRDYPHTAILYGHIVDEQNKPLEGVRVWPHSFGGELAVPDPDSIAPKKIGDELRALFSTTTNRYGDFCLSLRFAGDQLKVQNIELTKRGFVHVLDKREYHLAPDGHCRIDYTLTPGEVLAGRVDPLIGGPSHWPRHDGEDPFSAVIFITGDMFDGWVGSEDGGAFEVYVPPGTYTLSTHWAPGEKLTGIRSGTRDILVRRPSPAITKPESRRALQALWDDMDRHYSYFTIKPEVDWSKLRDEYLAKVEACETRDQFLYEVAGLLRHLDDLHIWIKAGEEKIGTGGRGYHLAWNPRAVEQRLTGLQVIDNFARIASLKDSRCAYLEVTALQATPEDVDSLLAAMDQRRDAPGFIVDMRRCPGGNELIAQQIAQFFCDREIVYAKNKYRDGPQHDQFGEDIERRLSPAKDPYTNPVVCLIANGTMSSGDSFAQMLDALPHVVTVGERTRGSSGNPAPFTLPGFDVQVWYSRWFDMGPDGNVVEGVGVAPDILIDQSPAAYDDADPIFERGLHVLHSRVGAD